MIGGSALTCGDVVDVAVRRRGVELHPDVLDRVAASHEHAVRIVVDRHVYGRTTGVGANRDVTVGGPDQQPSGASDAQEAAHVEALLRSHATAAGEPRSPERVRGMLLVRLHQLASGASGAAPAVVQALLGMVQADALPAVRELGAVGTGDLPALAAAALALRGDVPTSSPLPRTVAFGVHDALPFLSSSAATIADSAIAQHQLHRLSRAAVVVAALTFTAVRGNPEAFSTPVEQASPFTGARQVCRWVRALVDTTTPGARLQDPYGLRTLPQVQGNLLDSLEHLARITEAHANSSSENPLVVVRTPGDPAIPDPAIPDPATDVPHHGAFHLAPLATALDATRSAVVQGAQLSLTRLALLVEPRYTSLQPFLSDGVPGSSGIMPLEYVAASALGQLRLLAAPVAVQTVSLSRGAEDDASFASTGARAALDVVPALRVLLACELVAAVRAVRERGTTPATPPLLRQVLSACTDLPDDRRDRDLSPDLDVAASLLDGLAELLPGAGTLDPT